MAELLQDVLRDTGRRCQHLAVGGGHGGRQNTGQDQARQHRRQHTVLCNEAGNAHDEGLAGRAAQEFQRTGFGHAQTHHADDDGGRHGNDHPHAGNAAAEHQLLFVLNGHEPQQDVGHAKVAQAPGHGGHDVQQAVGGGGPGGSVVAGRHGQVAGKAAGVFHHGTPAPGHTDAVGQHRHQCDAHDHRLDEVGGGHGPEAAQNGVPHDDQCGHDHRDHVVHAEQAVEQLAAGRKAGSRVRDKEHDDDHRAQRVDQVALVMEPQRQELRHRDGVQIGRVAPQPPGHDEPVEPGAHGQTDGRPARRRNAGEVGKAGQAHQQPAGHIAGFRAHSSDQRAHLAAAEVEVGAVLVGLAVSKAHQQHAHQIDHNGGNDADICHKGSPSRLAFPAQRAGKGWCYFITVKYQSTAFCACTADFRAFVGISGPERRIFCHFANSISPLSACAERHFCCFALSF